LLVTPDLTLKPLLRLRDMLAGAPDDLLIGGVSGLLVALVLAALLAVPLSLLPAPVSRFLPLAACLLLVYFGLTLGVRRGRGIAQRLGVAPVSAEGQGKKIVVDSSAIIDGRLPAIAAAGFLPGRLLVPDFVVDELQGLADSSNPTVRARGRRGLDLLVQLRQLEGGGVEIISHPEQGAGPVDSRLIATAQAERAALLTNDANLARVAELHQLRALSLHALASALRPQLMPGEQTRVRVVQEGTEPTQGRAYLPDGTLVVVEGGRRFLGKELDVVISRSVQTAQGQLFFAHPLPGDAGPLTPTPLSRRDEQG
jgi:uncharacterized protein YacL